MKNEIEERLIIQEEISEQIIKRVGELEKRDYPDYIASTAELKATALAVSGQVAVAEALVRNLPKAIEMKHRYTLDLKTRAWVIGLAIWVIAFIIVLSLYFSLRVENIRLKVNDLKYRAIRQVYPLQSDWADSSYRANADVMEKTTIQLEEQILVTTHAKDLAEQKQREAKEAQHSAEQLKRKTKTIHEKMLSK
ncbi:hypothetical protein [Mucilaginibacter sp.]|uniref:hypothetical protein n=1 Tax=Mucilaginibacter sp. TaxID=1882438 RepID=UPI0026045D1C|nr:hypothetical protein [Mucilaginibacter sp.]MDB4926122.1 hypothetical protein [Mucilaginibacter sp.]